MMRFFKSTTAGLLFLSVGGTTLAVPPCPERPTPPPCCADGRGYSRPETFGVYETRWRPWPIQNLGPSAPQTGEEALKNQVPRFEAPPAEEEDRKAPPPSTPREEPPARVPAATNNTTPGSETRTAPNAPATRPAGEVPERPAGPRQPLPPYEPQSPGGRPATGNGGTGENDPPPSLPFGPGSIKQASAPREANRASTISPAVRSGVTSPASTSDDPPPALPGTLANLAG
jgi:hypothetical protein